MTVPSLPRWFGRLIVLVALAAILPALPGCMKQNRPKSFDKVDTPNGATIKPEVWTAAEDATTTHSVQVSSAESWLLPFNMGARSFVVSQGAKGATYNSFTWNDLGTIILFLPLRIRWADYHFTKDATTADGKRGFMWTPLWAYAWNKGNYPGLKFFAKGIPLLGAYIHVTPEKKQGTDFKLFTSLWSLGPMYTGMDTNMGRDRINICAFTPLFLGGALGSLLWSDINFKGYRDDERRAKFVGHGPFFGGLGFAYVKSARVAPLTVRAEDGTETTTIEKAGSRRYRGIFAGLLWTDVTNWDTKDKVVDSRSGLLWSGFGGGSKDGRPTMRLFWIPIKL